MIITVQDKDKEILAIERGNDETGYEFLKNFFVIGEFLTYPRSVLEDAIFQMAEEIGESIDNIGKECSKGEYD